MKVSQSMLKDFRRCKRKFKYKYLEGLEPRLPAERLRLGTWVHMLLEVYYKGGDWKKAHAKETKKFNNLFLEEREFYGPLPEKAERLMKAYLFHWRKEDKDWKVLHVEETFETKAFTGDIYTFKPDLIVETKKGMLLAVDHKTTRSIPEAEARLSDYQSALYPAGLRELGYEVDAFVFNYIRTKEPSIPKINKDGTISRARIDTDFYTLKKFLKEYYGEDPIPERWMTQLRTLRQHNKFLKRIYIQKAGPLVDRMIREFDLTTQEIEAWIDFEQDPDMPDPWVRTMIRSCDWDCDFYDLCMTELLGGDGERLRKTKFQGSQYVKERGLGTEE